MLNIGDTAPSFSARDAEGNSYSLSDLKGKFVVLYFYPEDETPGCTVEACSFRDSYAEFSKHNAVVLGVSMDTAESHQKFAAHHQLQFPLLIDSDRKIIDKYEAYGEEDLYGKKFMGIKRMTYLIGPDGKIAFIWRRAIPLGHAQQVLNKIKDLE